MHPRGEPVVGPYRAAGPEHEIVLHLRTFGTLDLRTSGGTSAGSLLAQPRSTALLVYLLLARPRGYLRRDTLCALFWPDSDDEHARGALSQALTRIRRSAGDDVFQLRGKTELRVAPGAMACDVLAFEDALAAGDHAVALEWYAGPFLHGFHGPHMPGFEAWAETERDRWRSLAAGAARALALQHIAGGRLAEARESAARALALAPESEAVARELVRALSTAGDRVAALSLYDSWAATLARELDLEPSDDARALARELRASAPPAAPPPPPTRDPAEGGAGGRAVETPPGADSRAAIAPVTASGLRLRRRVATATAAGALLLLAGWGLMHAGLFAAGYPVEGRGRTEVGPAPLGWLVVAEFEAPSGDPALALAFQTLLIRDLESAGYASVLGGLGALSRHGLGDALVRMRLPPDTRVDPGLACQIAEREGAAGVLAGRVLPLGDEYVLAASVLEATECHELIGASAVAPFDQLSRAATAVSRELRARLGESRASIWSSPPLPPMTTEFVEALRAVSLYLSDPDLWDEARGAAQLLEAIRIDPDFPFAHFLLALHYQRLGRYAQAVPHVLRAYELRSHLPRYGRLGMEAIYLRYIESDPVAAMATVATIVADYPATADATMPFLADAALWAGEWQRALDVSLEYLGTGPDGLGARTAHTTACAAAWALGRVELADSLYRSAPAARRGSDPPPDRSATLLNHLRHRDWEGAEAYCAENTGWDRCGYVYLARGKLSAAEDILLATLASDTAGRHPWERAAATAGLTHVELLRGQPDSAWALIQRTDRPVLAAGPGRAANHLNRFLLCAAAAGLGRSGELPECSIEAEDPADWDADPSFTVVLRSGAWSRRLLALRSLERGDAVSALEQARAAVRSNFGNPGLLDHLVQGMAFDAMARPDSALAHYLEAARIERDGCFPTAAGVAFPLAPVYRRIGELAEEAGDHATSLRYYGAFLDLWAEAEPELQPQVQAVRERTARLLGRGNP